MIACFPREIPAEAGCVVVRVIEPETPKERALAEEARQAALKYGSGAPEADTIPLWRITLWTDGRMLITAVLHHRQPTLAAALMSYEMFPLKWAEVVRGKAA